MENTMTTIDKLLDGSATIKEAAGAFIEDPLAFFDMSLTKMQSVPRGILEELQTQALSMRFEQQRDRIPALSKLADAQGITRIGEFDEVLPVCFEHTVFKSYPSLLLEKGQFDKLTTWLNRLTVHDLSKVDTSGCASIHTWLDLLCAETEVDPVATAGASGTMSFTPRDKSDWRTQVLGGLRIQMLQKFGEPPSESDLNDKLHVFWPTHADGHTSMFRTGHYVHKFMAKGDDDHFHPVYDSPGDTDVMFLAARLRAAQARGDSRVNVLPSLLERRAELEQIERERPARTAEWLESLVSDLSGRRVFVMGPWMLLYDFAKKGLAEGKKCKLAPNSIFQTGGGGKGMVVPDDWADVTGRFFGAGFKWVYGFNELTALSLKCEHDRYHIVPWAIPLVLDPETSKPLPRSGVQVGRAAFFDVAINGIWGGIISGDKVEIDWSECPCGRTSTHISDKIVNISEEKGGSDKITCAATPQAHAEALDFLTSFST
jgi:hypothetical protein